jgi:hypothetical protein
MTTRWFCEDADFTQISAADKAIRDRIIAIIDRHTQEMEHYGYFGSNPGVSVQDYEDVADEIMVEFGIASK